MMKGCIWRRLLALVMTLVMLLGVFPTAAIASLLDNDPAVNQEILARLADVVGSEEEAARYYDLLRQYGLLDESGNEIESWDIYFNGEKVTLDYLRSLLDDPDCDLSQYLIVDGSIVTLGELKTMLEIEDYISYLREKYFTDQKWTREQLVSLQSLVDQINSQGIEIYAAGNAISWPSGVDHNARVSVSQTAFDETAGTATFTAKLEDAMKDQVVTFQYHVYSGSQRAYIEGDDPVNGKLTLTAGSDGTQEAGFEVRVPKMTPDEVMINVGPVYYVNCDNITNALFSGDGDAISLKCTGKSTTDSYPSEFHLTAKADDDATPDVDNLNYINLGIINRLEVDDGYYTSVMNSANDVFISDSDDGPDGYMAWIFPELGNELYLRTVNWAVELTYKSGDKQTLSGAYSAIIDPDTSMNATPTVKIDGTSLYALNNILDDAHDELTGIKVIKAETYTDDYDYHPDSGWKLDREGIMPQDPYTLTLRFSDTRAPSAEKIDFPSGTFYPGQVVPISVTYSEPVAPYFSYVGFEGSGQIKSAEPSNLYAILSNVLTFPYEVTEGGNVNVHINQIWASDYSRNSIRWDEATDFPAGILDGNKNATMSTPHSHAVTGVSAQVTNGETDATLEIDVSILNNDSINLWLVNDINPNTRETTALQVKVDGGDTTYPLTLKGDTVAEGLSASVSIPLNTEGETVTHVVELVLDGKLLIGKYATATQAAAKFITADDVTLTLTARKPGGGAYADGEIIYVQDNPTLKADYSLKDKGSYSFETADQFVWSSSNPNIANIDQDGVITPTGEAGEVFFTLTVKNGGVAGREVTKNTKKLTFGVGLTPFLLIPHDDLQGVDGQSLTLYWSSNLCDKNGATPTTFTVNAVRGGDAALSYTTTLSGTAAKPVANVTIPGSALAYDYDSPARNTVTVTVSSVYESVKYSAQATITLSSQPAVVTFHELESYYITDQTKSVDIGWTVQNFDRFSGDGQLFEMLITKGNTDLAPITDPGAEQGVGKGSYTGSYTLDIPDVVASESDPTSYREVYTVTIKAKNGADSTWSHDSFMLYVYDTQALKILVGGDAASGVTLSNVSDVSQKNQDQILAMNRDIYLKRIISVNHGQYHWNEIADQIAWNSSNDSVATVNYQQGSLYENINNFTYSAYRPTTELGLSGISNGSALVKAVHKLTGMEVDLNVQVETLKDRLYLFQLYPQVETTLTYTNGDGVEKTVTSNAAGAAAIYEPKGIVSNVYCRAEIGDVTYLGTFFLDDIKTGEGDWTLLERYPLNNLTMRQAAYAYLYVKDPDGTPHAGDVIFRGGVYVDGMYKPNAHFGLNGSVVDLEGDQNQRIALDSDGKLTITMDQTEWGLPDNKVTSGDNVRYVFEIIPDSTDRYPLFVDVNTAINQDAFVSSGEAIVTFCENDAGEKHPFIAMQTLNYTGYPLPANVINDTGKIGPSDSLPEANLTTAVLWWGENTDGLTPTLQLLTDKETLIADGEGEYIVDSTSYPFTDDLVTQYTVRLNGNSLEGVVESGKSVGLCLNYYKDGSTLNRHEPLPFQLTNMLGIGKAEEVESISEMLSNLGAYTDSDASEAKSMDLGDAFLTVALNFAASGDYSDSRDGKFSIRLSPTSDPTKFLGFIQVNVGNMPEKELVMGNEFDGAKKTNYMPGLSEIILLTGKREIEDLEDYFKTFKSKTRFELEGYLESLLYFDEDSMSWKIQILNGGFELGGGKEWYFNFNTMAGIVPFTATLTIGGNAELGMDALSVAYYNETQGKNGLGNDFLTQLRICLYLKFFAGVGIDYAVVAFKLGIYGQIQLDIRLRWLNRPYMDDTYDRIVNTADGSVGNKDIKHNLNGQHYRVDGQIGLEFVARVLFISYEKVLWSYGFNMLDKASGDWDKIASNWEANQAAQQKAISGLLNTKALSVTRVGTTPMLSLNLAPTLESRDYLTAEERVWGPGISLLALDQTSGLANLESNTYPYANPVVTDDGAVVVYLSDMGSASVNDTRVAFATKSGASYEPQGAIHDGGYGDSQVALAGTEDFAVAAWTRHTVSVNKDAGATLTDDDQMILMNGSDIFASIYSGGTWTTVPLVESNSTADLAPVVATNGDRAIVAWRSVASGTAIDDAGNSYNAITHFNEKDTILYRIYNGQSWGEAVTLYNGTSGEVKGIVASMLDDGSAAVAYTLDLDGDDAGETTITDRDVYYAVISAQSGQVVRNVRATRDNYLDENPQLAAVCFPNDPLGHAQHFILGWYSEHPADADLSGVVDAAQDDSDIISDIRLVEFNNEGITEQLLPDSISQVAADYDVSVTPTFRFAKNASTINDLSILWVERNQGAVEDIDDSEGTNTSGPSSGQHAASTQVERDVLKGVKFYTYGQGDLVSFTGAVDVAEMDEGTLIDHFDAYVSNPATNEVKAVILGSAYGADGATETKQGETMDGQTVTYAVPKRTTSMYTATETYADKIRVNVVLAEYDTVKLGATTHIMFTVENAGIHAVNALSFDVGGTQTEYTGLNLLPGKRIQLYADYYVPLDGVVDPAYTVTAAFNQDVGANGVARVIQTATGVIYLDRPDLEVIQAKIIEEVDGLRTIQLKLNNDSHATLTKPGRSVKLSFYTDVSCETPFYGLDPITISDGKELKMLDEGGYSVQLIFDVEEYLSVIAQAEGNNSITATEIPDEGIKIFVKAEVLQDGEVLAEPVSSNNYANVTVENLYVRTGKHVSVTSDFETDPAENKITVTVNVQNNHLASSENGEVVVRLLGKNGEELLEVESRHWETGILALPGEGKSTGVFTIIFDDDELTAGLSPSDVAAVEVLYIDNIFAENSSDLLELTVSGEGIGGVDLNSFTEDPERPGVYTLSKSIKVDDLTTVTVTALAQSVRTQLTVQSGDAVFTSTGSISADVGLTSGENNTITITATSGDGMVTKTYILTILMPGGTRFKVETQTLAEAFDSYPAAIRAQYGDAKTMEEALLANITAQGVAERNTAIYDEELLVTQDDGATWTAVTADNFPASGVTVTLPYPDGTNRSDYDFNGSFPAGSRRPVGHRLAPGHKH